MSLCFPKLILFKFCLGLENIGSSKQLAFVVGSLKIFFFRQHRGVASNISVTHRRKIDANHKNSDSISYSLTFLTSVGKPEGILILSMTQSSVDCLKSIDKQCKVNNLRHKVHWVAANILYLSRTCGVSLVLMS